MSPRKILSPYRIGLGLLLSLTVAMAIVAYCVSPLRDPSFVPQAANAGATVSWLSPERYWTVAIHGLAITLATTLTLLIGAWPPYRRALAYGGTGGKSLSLCLKVIGLAAVWLLSAYITWYLSLYYLLWQYILD